MGLSYNLENFDQATATHVPQIHFAHYKWTASCGWLESTENFTIKISQLGQPRGQYSIIQDLYPKLNGVWKLINQKLSQEFAMENENDAWAFS